MKRRVCLITGATDGVGRATALELARKGFHVVIAARNATKAEALKREIEAEAEGSAEYIVADLASLAEVRELGAAFRRRHATLDALVNNAGVFLRERTVTADGYETTFQVNYLSHFLLTRLLLDELQKSEQGRIINLSSSVHSAGKLDPGNLQSEKRFSVFGTYAATKLFMLMFTMELAARLRGTRVTANAVHPGIVRTQMMMNAPGAFRVLSYLALPFSVSAESGARTTVHVATAPELAEVTGCYFAGPQPTDTKNRFNTEENRRQLWHVSKALLGEAA